MESLIRGFHTYKDIDEQISKMYKRRQQSLGPLYIMAVVKATPACTPVNIEIVGYVSRCISDLKYCITPCINML